MWIGFCFYYPIRKLLLHVAPRDSSEVVSKNQGADFFVSTKIRKCHENRECLVIAIGILKEANVSAAKSMAALEQEAEFDIVGLQLAYERGTRCEFGGCVELEVGELCTR